VAHTEADLYVQQISENTTTINTMSR